MEGDNEIGDSVILIPGSWHSSDCVSWKFTLSQTFLARNVKLNSHTTFREFHRLIAESFSVDLADISIRTSYCVPLDEKGGRQGRIPFESILKDSDVSEFLQKFRACRDLNLLVSFEGLEKNVESTEHHSLPEAPDPELYDTDGLDNSELIAVVEVVEASLWNKRARDEVIGLDDVVSKVRRSYAGGNSIADVMELSQLPGNSTEDYVSLAEGNDYEKNDVDVAPFGNFNLCETVRSRERDVDSIVADRDPYILSKGNELNVESLLTGSTEEEYNVIHECGRGMPTLDSEEAAIPTQYGRGMPTVDSEDADIDTQYGPEFMELARLADLEAARGSGETEICDISNEDNGANNLEVPSFDLGIDNHAVGDNNPDTVDRISSPSVQTHYTARAYSQSSRDGSRAYSMSMSSIETDDTPMADNISGFGSNLDLANTTIYRGRVFDCKKDMKMCLSVYAVENTFCFKVDKSDKSRWVAICVDSRCKWRVRALPVNQSDSFVVTKTVLDHTCDVSSRARYVEKASASVIARLMQIKYSDGKKGPRAVDLMDIVFEQLKVNISYIKAWNIREIAVGCARGSAEENYLFLSTYLHLLKVSNPGSITDIVTSLDQHGNTQFKYLFMALGACIKGFKFLRRVVVIDGTHLKGKYKGCLVSASGQDANLHIFPLAFGVVDSENEDSWVWFLQKLSMFVYDDSNLVFVSDRHNAIYAALKRVYPKAHHGACTVHLWRNVKARFKSNALATAMSKAARSYTIGDFKYWWGEIKKRSPACCTFLERIGFQHWALCYFEGQRYNIMSSNIAESLNHAMGKAVDFPIVSMLEYLRTMLMRWFSDRKEESVKCGSKCPPRIEDVLIDKFNLSTSCSVRRCSRHMFQVSNKHGHVFTVDLQKKTCTCKAFEILKLPCPHAIAACSSKKLDIYNFVDILYLKHAWELCYEVPILPLPRREDIDIPEAIRGIALFPPSVRRQSGRPRMLRIPSVGEDQQDKGGRCTRCGLRGHNRATCDNPI